MIVVGGGLPKHQRIRRMFTPAGRNVFPQIDTVGPRLARRTTTLAKDHLDAELDAGAEDRPPTNFTDSCPFRTLGVMAYVPPQSVVATRPAVSAPAKGKVKPLVMPPRMQKVALNGA
jgi:hypothetical protein